MPGMRGSVRAQTNDSNFIILSAVSTSSASAVAKPTRFSVCAIAARRPCSSSTTRTTALGTGTSRDRQRMKSPFGDLTFAVTQPLAGRSISVGPYPRGEVRNRGGVVKTLLAHPGPWGDAIGRASREFRSMPITDSSSQQPSLAVMFAPSRSGPDGAAGTHADSRFCERYQPGLGTSA